MRPSEARAWSVPTLADDPVREAYVLLGPAWRSSSPQPVQTGSTFDVVQAPQALAAPALDGLRRAGRDHGAVFADGTRWTFFVTPGSGSHAWPPWVTYRSGPALLLPPRAARAGDLGLRWITRGAPPGRLCTPAEALCTSLSTPAHRRPRLHTPRT
ncbi:hypothetical protein [Streptomyces sp. NPDC001508]|uniref:hypothetical protein n=1 Tax=Streptomyces sp. NPDC001508 TaxID=3154656 RepID=UPI003318314B